VTQDGVHAILGEVASSRSIAAAPIAQNAKIPMLTPSSTNPEVTRKGDYIFRSCFIDPVQGAAIAQFAARTLNAKRAGIMVDRKNDYSTGLEKFISQTFTKLGGQMVVTQSYQAGDQDFNAQITSIKGANPDVLLRRRRAVCEASPRQGRHCAAGRRRRMGCKTTLRNRRQGRGRFILQQPLLAI
jgi:branched-chain amino acid transport system substrate-binding protein